MPPFESTKEAAKIAVESAGDTATWRWVISGVASGLGMAVRSISPAAGQVGPAGSSIVDSIRRLYQEMQNRNATP